MDTDQQVRQSFQYAKEAYFELDVDVEQALETLAAIPISINCWQGDDVQGFESLADIGDGGLQVTGNYPGRARTPDELRADARKAMSLIPGTHRFNLHAIYGDFQEGAPERNEIGPEHFSRWIDWAKDLGIGLDFNPTFFAHEMVKDGLTLSHPDARVRDYWIEHGKACRKIGEAMGKALGTPSVVNVWIPDGSKDLPYDRKGPREHLAGSLDAVFAENIDPAHMKDAVESKLFGIGVESYTVGSHEFYLGYALKNNTLLCLDSGHFHPTEQVGDKISAILTFLDELLLHISRPVRWDSDHIVIQDDMLRLIAEGIIRGEYLSRVNIGLDFFDATVNRLAAWIVGTRAVQKALLKALLEPHNYLAQLELDANKTERLALFETMKSLPFGAVWDYFCRQQDVPPRMAWLDKVKEYERTILSQRQ
ncbi:MAG: L-rhamnose isomerase [Candidatus Marinimicrobia bacterium]|nr:L-rhamnose isomerase [Candidatus Neomarinimicrobiota bacterium]MCF7828316.1 L-rhamnose isomerase [Candidatus Neomarinimicrobiota bacterium]MCF7879509.1 L-rhamnose isomerase [Candidatus Neomarinimicrobiota bacterium]